MWACLALPLFEFNRRAVSVSESSLCHFFPQRQRVLCPPVPPRTLWQRKCPCSARASRGNPLNDPSGCHNPTTVIYVSIISWFVLDCSLSASCRHTVVGKSAASCTITHMHAWERGARRYHTVTTEACTMVKV